jgi:hypothetical protein
MMRLMLSVVMALTLCVGGSLMAADKPVTGTITKIEKDKDTITLSVSIAAKKKDAAAGNTDKQEKKFTIKNDMKVEKVTGKKGEQKHSDAKIDDLKEGVVVIITAKGDKVEKLEINGGKKGK